MAYEVCLSLTHSGTVVFRGLTFGEGLGPIFLDRVSCSSNSPSLLECDSNPLGVHTCSHSQDVGIQCICKGSPVSRLSLSFLYFHTPKSFIPGEPGYEAKLRSIKFS